MATNPLLTRRKVVRVSQESTPGTLEAPAVEVLALEAEINPTNSPFQQRQPLGGSLGNAVGIVGERGGVASIRAELRGDGVDDLDAGLEVLFKACGFAKGSGNVYSPVSAAASQETLSLDVFEDGLRKRLTGAAGNPIIEAEFGKQAFCRFELSGVWNAVADSGLPTPTHSAIIPPRFAGATVTIGAYTPLISNFALNMNNNVVPQEDPAAAAALIRYLISERDAVVTMDPEAVLGAAYDPFALWLAGTTAALQIIIGSAGGNIIQIDAPKLQHREPAAGERDGKLTHELTGQLVVNSDAGDDEVTITPS